LSLKAVKRSEFLADTTRGLVWSRGSSAKSCSVDFAESTAFFADVLAIVLLSIIWTKKSFDYGHP